MELKTIENYLKALFHLSNANKTAVTNKELSSYLKFIPATVTETVKKLSELNYVIYEKSYGTRLSTQGLKLAIEMVRKHRLWETYLVQELGFEWDEVHDIAEELEHIQNKKLIARLSEKLGHPHYDPHGDPIPDEKGKFLKTDFILLANVRDKKHYTIRQTLDHSKEFLNYLKEKKLLIGSKISILKREMLDNSITYKTGKEQGIITETLSKKIVVEEIE
jgi:DtxR family Mn-dependent transcriptional regulator